MGFGLALLASSVQCVVRRRLPQMPSPGPSPVFVILAFMSISWPPCSGCPLCVTCVPVLSSDDVVAYWCVSLWSARPGCPGSTSPSDVNVISICDVFGWRLVNDFASRVPPRYCDLHLEDTSAPLHHQA